MAADQGKNLAIVGVHGAGRKTLMGNLIYKVIFIFLTLVYTDITRCGMDMLLLQRFEKAGLRRYDEVVPFLHAEKIKASFHARSFEVYMTLSGDNPAAEALCEPIDGILCVVDVSAT